MNQYMIIQLAKDALSIVITIAGPILIIGMIVGLFISIVQTVTSIQDSTLSMVPKLAAMLLTIFFLANWMLNILVSYTRQLLGDFTQYIR
jgi:flagellar biosynthetic protein FliQ